MPHSNVPILRILLLVGLSGLMPHAFNASQELGRLHAHIDDSETFILKGHTRPVVGSGIAEDQGEVAGSHSMPRMALHFSETSAQQADLTHLLADLQNRRSPHFHKFLTPEEYGARFGLDTADLQKSRVGWRTADFQI